MHSIKRGCLKAWGSRQHVLAVEGWGGGGRNQHTDDSTGQTELNQWDLINKAVHFLLIVYIKDVLIMQFNPTDSYSGLVNAIDFNRTYSQESVPGIVVLASSTSGHVLGFFKRY